MAADKKPSTKAQGWKFFDRIVDVAAPDGKHSNPWHRNADGSLRYEPDFTTLQKLLAVPLHLHAPTTSGVPALALDVWLSYELRRAGFDPDAVWPRPTPPRILPEPVVRFVEGLPRRDQPAAWARLRNRTPPPGAAASEAIILGKNYLKQVDVVMSNWQAGPELLISTKRMDSSFSKNAPNRVEEAYGDAKNLRLRHPLAALGLFFGIRSTVFTEAPNTADWIVDLMQKLGQEDDAYHSTCLLPIQYDDELPDADTDSASNEGNDGDVSGASEAGLKPHDESSGQSTVDVDEAVELDIAIAEFPTVTIRQDLVPERLHVDIFLAQIVQRVLGTTPITLHAEARRRYREVSRHASWQATRRHGSHEN